VKSKPGSKPASSRPTWQAEPAGGGLRREFTADQAERVRLLKALQARGAKLSQLARADLALAGQAFVVYDGHELRACRDAAAAIATVVRSRRPCLAVDLAAIRMESHG
jgi:hypothetical protein